MLLKQIKHTRHNELTTGKRTKLFKAVSPRSKTRLSECATTVSWYKREKENFETHLKQDIKALDPRYIIEVARWVGQKSWVASQNKFGSKHVNVFSVDRKWAGSRVGLTHKHFFVHFFY